MSLQNKQADFVEALLTKDTTLDCIRPSSHILIHLNNIQTNLTEALKNTYPLLLKLLGEEFFKVAAQEYMYRYPSRSSNLHDYGRYFGDFLSQYDPVNELIYLSEVAEFEWACHILYVAADHPPFKTQSLEKFTPEQHGHIHFLLHPASWIHRFQFPILDIVDLCKEDPEGTVDLDKGGINLLVLRKELDLTLTPLNQADFFFLEALNQDSSLNDALHLAKSVDPEYGLAEKLPAFIQKGIIVDCSLSSED